MEKSRFQRVKEDLTVIPTVLQEFNSIIYNAKSDVKIKGNLQEQSMKLPYLTEHYYGVLQEIEAILKHVEIIRDHQRAKVYRKFIESYARDIKGSDAARFIDSEKEVIDMEKLVNEVCLTRNKLLGIFKALEHKNWHISNIIKLRVAGIEDAALDEW